MELLWSDGGCQRYRPLRLNDSGFACAVVRSQSRSTPRVPLCVGRGWLGVATRILIGLAILAIPYAALADDLVQYTYDAAGNIVGITRTTIAPRPDLRATNLAVGSISVNADGGYNIPVTFTVSNVGTAAAVATWLDGGYLSTTPTLTDAVQILSGFVTHSTNLAVGASYVASATLVTTAATTAGSYYLIVKTDAGNSASGQYGPTGANRIAERYEDNNTQSVAITLPAKVPDLRVTTASIGMIIVNQNGSYGLPITYTVTNAGTLTAPAGWYDQAYLSNDPALDNGDVPLTGAPYRSSALAPTASYTNTTTFTTTTTAAVGSYTVFVKADGRTSSDYQGSNTDSGRISESNETNNTFSIPVTLPARPDLMVTSASVGAITVAQNGAYNIPVTFSVNNLGGAAAQSYWYDLAYLSTDGVLDNADQNLSGYNGNSYPLAAGGS
jgi:hypothetical protein